MSATCSILAKIILSTQKSKNGSSLSTKSEKYEPSPINGFQWQGKLWDPCVLAESELKFDFNLIILSIFSRICHKLKFLFMIMSRSLRWRFPRRINNLNPQPSEPSYQSKHPLLLRKIQLLILSILPQIYAYWFYLPLKLLWELCGCYYHTDYEISWSPLWFSHQLQDTIRVMFSQSIWRPLYSFDYFSQQKQITLRHLQWDIWQLTQPDLKIE